MSGVEHSGIAESEPSPPAERETPAEIPPGGKPSEAAPPIAWWHLAAGAALTALLAFFIPHGRSWEYASLTEGSISPVKIVAPFDFEILKSPEQLQAEREAAAAEVPPVMVQDDSAAEAAVNSLAWFSDDLVAKLGNLAKTHSPLDWRGNDTAVVDSLSVEVARRHNLQLDATTWRFLAKLYTVGGGGGALRRFIQRDLAGVVEALFRRGVVDVVRQEWESRSGRVVVQRGGEETERSADDLVAAVEAPEWVAAQMAESGLVPGYPSGWEAATRDLVEAFLRPNLRYDRTETEARRQAAVARVPLAKGLVKKDELIIDANIRVTSEHMEKLNSLAVKRAELHLERGGWRGVLPIVGKVVVLGSVMVLLGWFVRHTRPAVWEDWRRVLIVSVILAMVHAFQSLVLVPNGWGMFLFPVGVGVMMLAILVDRAVALAALAAMALVAGMVGGYDFPQTLVVLAAGGVALFAVKQVQNRGDLMQAGLYLLGAYVILVLGLGLSGYNSPETIGKNLMLGGVNALMSPILALGLVYLFEKLFGVTTDLTLLELVDLNRPLLRELAMKSPGTYHHSIMVGSLAEAAARAIGANALLTRAGAYYHDIGKLVNTEYFIENQESGSPNVHDHLSPEKSAQVVIDHVRRGVEIAARHRLPPQVTAFITEHHGRTRLAYFYAKAEREQGKGVPDDLFRYPGPSPQTKETGILMLADLVEAASRSMEPQNQDEIRRIVADLIRMRLTEGDLDQTPLTMQELGRIQEAFVQVLTGIYHQRIPYPGQKETQSSPVRD